MVTRAWPLVQCIADFTGGPPSLPSGAAVDMFAPGSPVALRQWATARGRQYELGTVQAGMLSMDLVDSRERLNPLNTGSSWNSGVNSLLPYRRVQLGAWWRQSTKDTSGNLLNSANLIPGTAVPFDPSFEGGGLGGWFGFAGAPTIVNSSAQAFNGTKSVACTFTGATDLPTVALFQPRDRVQTVSLYVFVPAAHTVTLSWINFPGVVGSTIGTATSSTTGAWQRLTITGTPSATNSLLELTCTAVYPATVYVDAMQLELGAAASAFTTAGPTYFGVFTGYIERYPQAWDMAGFRGRKPLTAVDALSPLSRTTISQSYAATVLADGPAVFVPYSDDAFPPAVQRLTGGQPMIPYQQLGSQSASVTFGGDSFLDGSKAVSLTQQNTDPPSLNDSTQITYLGTRQGGLAMNPQSFAIETWFKFSAGQVFFGGGSMTFGQTTVGVPAGPPIQIGWKTFANALSVIYGDTNGQVQINRSFVNQVGTPKYADPYWHHVTICCLGSNTYQFSIDGKFSAVVTFDNPTPPPMVINNLYFDTPTYYGDMISTSSLANMALYSAPLTTTQITNHYQRGIGYLGEKSGTRALRLLTQYWSTNVVTDTGLTSMAADFSYNGRAMLDVLQEIADTEAGLVWVDAEGFVHQDSRETRYTTTTSNTAQFVFGENSAGGELPYETLGYDYDPTYVFSQANITSGGTGTQLTPVVNATSQTAYGQRVLSKTLQTANDWDAGQAGLFYAARYAKPAGAPGTGVPPRITGMTINPGANPDLWTAALTLDVGYRVTVKRRTSAGVTISGDYYVEQINHSATGDASWTVTYQLSPVFVPQAWVLGDATKGVLGTTTVCVY